MGPTISTNVAYDVQQHWSFINSQTPLIKSWFRVQLLQRVACNNGHETTAGGV